MPQVNYENSILRLIFFLCCFQVLEYDSPDKLLSNEASAFYKMVQSTGAANAEYLCSLVFGRIVNNSNEENKGLENQMRQLASSNWAAATQCAIAATLSSLHLNLQSPNETKDNKDFLEKTKDALTTLQEVLEGKHDDVIQQTLVKYNVPTERWWSTLYQLVEGKHNDLNFMKKNSS